MAKHLPSKWEALGPSILQYHKHKQKQSKANTAEVYSIR